jgi:beta-lactam-binding protein with PASTA domain
VALLLIMLALFGFAFFTPNHAAPSGGGRAEEIPAATVPTVTGLSTRYAVRRLRAAGLVAEERWCTARAVEYAVRRVQPREGTVVPRGMRVRLYLVPALGSGVRQPVCKRFVGAKP